MAMSFQDGEENTNYLEDRFEAIAQLGTGARVAIPRLEELRKHQNPWVRLWASEALEKIRPAKS